VLLRILMGARFSDAQCGFKAIRRDQARVLLPLTQDTGWFFDTELLVLAERAGLRIHEVPVDWIDDLDSRVDIIGTALADLCGIARLGIGFARGTIQVPQLRGPSLAARRDGSEPTTSRSLPWQIARFAVVGAGSTVAYLGLYLVLRGSMSAQAANLISVLLTAAANTAANRRLTFGITGRPNAARHQFKGLPTFGIGLALTAGSLAVLHANSPHPGRGTEIAVLLTANLVAGTLRFALCRTWVFGPSKRGAGYLPAETDDSARGEPVRLSPVESFGQLSS
jgi:putative flippase GtrA